MSSTGSSPTTRRGGRRKQILSGVLVLCLLAIGWAAWSFRAEPPEVLFLRGWQAYEARDLAALEAALNGLRRQLPRVTPTHTDSALANSRVSLQVQLLEGALLLVTGQPADALLPLKEVSRDEQLGPRARFLASRAYYDLNRLHDAEVVLRELVQLHPQMTDAHRLLGGLYFDLGANPQAIEQLEWVVAQDARDSRAPRLIGLMRKDFQQYAEAAAAYRETLRRDGDSPQANDVRRELAACLVELRQFVEAEAALDPRDDSLSATAVRVECASQRGEMERARELAAEQSPATTSSVELCRAIAAFWDEQQQLDLAVQWCERSLLLQPCDFGVRYRLSRLLTRLNRPVEAAAQLELMRRDQTLADRLHALQEQSISEPNNAELRYQMGQVAQEMGRTDLAAAWFRAALGLNPQHAPAAAELRSLNAAPE